MKKVLVTLLMSGAIYSVSAQVIQEEAVQKTLAANADAVAKAAADTTARSPWTLSGVAGFTLSQVSLTNWTAGGESSLAFDAIFNYSANYLKGKNLWTNRLELAFGMSNTNTLGTRKTNDKIYFSSNYGRAVTKSLYLGGMLTFNTQFANGYNYATTPITPVSRFMAPGYLTLGAGLIWTPEKWIKLTFNPASLKETFVFDDNLSGQGAYGVKVGSKVLTQLGANLVTEFTLTLMENVSLYSRIDLYSNYLKNPQNIVVHWDTQIAAKINKWISATLNINLIYDDNIMIGFADGSYHQAIQFKEVFGVGLQVQF